MSTNETPLHPDLPPVLDARSVSRVFGISERVAARWLAQGRIPSARIGKRRFCTREALLKALKPDDAGR